MIEIVNKNDSKKLYQWDLNREIAISADADVVDFAHKNDAEAVRVKPVNKDGVLTASIPNSLLQSSQPIVVWLVKGDQTIYGQVLPVIPRQKPADYVETEDDVLSYVALEKRVAELEKNAGGIAEETDPTVPDWAKQPEKPTYTAQEVGAAKAEKVAEIEDKINGYINGRYVTPESFGAAGSGKVDDTEAIQKAFDYAISNQMPIKCYGTYYITSPISISGRYNDVYINKIFYRGTEYAVELCGIIANHIVINQIEATKGYGLLLTNIPNVSGSARNAIKIERIESKYHCISMMSKNENATTITANNITAIDLYSSAGTCVYANNIYADNMLTAGFYRCKEPNFAFCLVDAGTLSVYNAILEKDAWAGFYIAGTTIPTNVKAQYCRVREMEDTMRAVNDNQGLVAKLVGEATIVGLQDCDLVAIDVSERKITNAPRTMYTFNAGGCRRFRNYNYEDGKSGNMSFNEAKILVYGNKKAFVPCEKVRIDLLSDLNINEYDVINPYLFNVLDNVTVTLDTSYCPIGIREFVVKQGESGKFVTIKDYNSQIIFNGSEYGTGEFLLTSICKQEKIDEHVWGFYENPEWMIRKIN